MIVNLVANQQITLFGVHFAVCGISKLEKLPAGIIPCREFFALLSDGCHVAYRFK